jgi:NADH-quinone oxidoreductase subunit L
MFFALGVGAFGAGIFHLVTHAFFKALLFLGAGVVMHAMNDMIDMRRLGGLRKVMPITFFTFLIGALALSGFPLFSGFFSKDEILAQGFIRGELALWFVAIVTALLTAFYTFRAVILTFAGTPRWKEGEVVHAQQEDAADAHGDSGHGSRGLHPHEPSPVMWVPLVILAIFSAFFGFAGLPPVIGENRIETFLEPVFHAGHIEIPETLEWLLIGISTAAALIGIFLAFRFYMLKPGTPARLTRYYPWLYNLWANKYWVDQFYDFTVARPGRWLANALWVDVDGRVINGIADGIGVTFRNLGQWLRGLQAGYARGYALAMLIGIVVVIAIVVMR